MTIAYDTEISELKQLILSISEKINEKIDNIDKKVDNIDKKVDIYTAKTDERLKSIENTVEEVKQQVNKLDGKIESQSNFFKGSLVTVIGILLTALVSIFVRLQIV